MPSVFDDFFSIFDDFSALSKIFSPLEGYFLLVGKVGKVVFLKPQNDNVFLCVFRNTLILSEMFICKDLLNLVFFC